MQKEPQQVPVTKLEFSSDKIIDCLLNAADHQDIENLRQEFKADNQTLRQEMKADNQALRQEVKGDIDNLRQEVNAQFREVNAQFRFVNKAIFGLFSLMLGGFSTIAYMIMKYMVVR